MVSVGDSSGGSGGMGGCAARAWDLVGRSVLLCVGLAVRAVDGRVNGRAAWLSISVAGIGGEVEVSDGEAARRVDACGPCWNAVGANCNMHLPLASTESFQCSHGSSEDASVKKNCNAVVGGHIYSKLVAIWATPACIVKTLNTPHQASSAYHSQLSTQFALRFNK
jgi:hypothetical protein